MIIACIAAGGSGTRFGGPTPKQFLPLCGVPVLVRALRRTLEVADCAVVGVDAAWVDAAKQLCDGESFGKKVLVTPGGDCRNRTLLCCAAMARRAFGAGSSDTLMTHDAARPLASSDLMRGHAAFAQAQTEGVATTVISATDTVVASHDGKILDEMPARERIYLSQTPQTFPLGLFEQVCAKTPEQVLQTATDPIRLFHLQGIAVSLIPGSPTNLKLTYAEDFVVAQALMESGGSGQ